MVVPSVWNNTELNVRTIMQSVDLRITQISWRCQKKEFRSGIVSVERAPFPGRQWTLPSK
jgi:hypothetical protein